MLKPGGTLTVIEGDHGSAYFHPRSDRAQRAIQCLVDLQARAHGDALIGRALYPLVTSAGYTDVRVSPRMVYVDASRPQLVEGFTKLTFTAMVEGVRDAAIAAGMLTAAEFDAGVADLYRTAEADGTFCYTFFKATAVNAEAPRLAAFRHSSAVSDPRPAARTRRPSAGSTGRSRRWRGCRPPARCRPRRCAAAP